MRPAKALNEKDIKKMIMEKYGVEEKDVQRMKYSYVVLLGKEEGDNEDKLETEAAE